MTCVHVIDEDRYPHASLSLRPFNANGRRAFGLRYSCAPRASIQWRPCGASKRHLIIDSEVR